MTEPIVEADGMKCEMYDSRVHCCFVASPLTGERNDR